MEPNNSSPNHRSPNRRTGILVLLAALFGVGLILYGGWDAIRAEMGNLRLLPLQEGFTELYFNDSTSLPTVAGAGKLISFSFSVHNNQGVSDVYPYVAYFEASDGSRTVLSTGTISLTSGASKAVTVSYTLDRKSTRLNSSHQIISYAVFCLKKKKN